MRLARYLVACVAAGLMAGCATQRAMNRSLADLQGLDVRLAQIESRLAAVDSLLDLQQNESRQQWAEQVAEGEQLQFQVLQLQARVDESAQRLGDVREEIEMLRVYGVGKGPARSTPAAKPEATVQAEPRPALVGDPQNLYDMAMADMKAANYQLAAGEFGQFVESFPQHELADNALYWQGECFYTEHQYAEAAACFERAVKDHPQGDKVPAALLKLGFTRLAMDQTKQGTQLLNDLVKRFPSSPEATQARAKLKALGKSPAKRPTKRSRR